MTDPLQFTPISPLPIAPTRTDPDSFSQRGDALMTALPVFQQQANTLAAQLMAAASAVVGQVGADNAASLAAAQAAAQAAMTAWAASMAPAETLPAIAASIHSGAIVRAMIYDTSRDSDGGAWRKRCRHTSWYNETLTMGVWRGQRANEAACRAVVGAAAGDYYQHATDGKFYMLVGGAGQAEVFRGNSREFPAFAALVLESARLIIYDLTQPGCPMWMVFVTQGSNFPSVTALGRTLATKNALAAINGTIYVGTAVASAECLIALSFIKDGLTNSSTGPYSWPGTLSQRNSLLTAFPLQAGTAPVLTSSVCNDVAVAVLPGAPVDAATGLPTPTIAVATAGGVGVIKDDGTYVNGGQVNSGWYVRAISFDKLNQLWASGGDAAYGALQLMAAPPFSSVASIGAGTTGYPQIGASLAYGANSTYPYTLGGHHAKTTLIGGGIPSSNGLTLLKDNPATRQKSMVAYITNAYNSGWMVGDVRGAWLANTTAETIAGAELCSNGAFSANTSGWSQVNATIAASGGELQITAAGNMARAQYPFSTVPGAAYVVTLTVRRGTCVSSVAINTDQGSEQISTNSTSNVPLTFNLTAVGATTNLNVVIYGNESGTTAYVDNVSIKRADHDRSVKNSGLIVNGSINKAAVAAGAQLVGYSGWSAANYLEQPYSANLDPGAGDWLFFMGWVNITTFAGGDNAIIHRTNIAGGGQGGFYVAVDVNTGYLSVYATASQVFTRLLYTTTPIQLGVYSFVEVLRISGVLYIRVNGVVLASVANSTNLSYANASTRLGVRCDGPDPMRGSMALVRVGGTAPTPEQSAQIYRDELALFQPGAQCTLAGSSSSVTALAYDEGVDLLHVGSSWGRSAFKGLQRVEAEATGVGAVAALSSSQGVLLQGGATGGRYTQAAMPLRDLLNKPRLGRLAGLDRQPASRSPRASNVQLSAADHGRLIDVTAGTFMQTADSADALGPDWWVIYRNSGTGVVTLPTADGVVTTLGRGASCLLSCDGTALSLVRLSRVPGVFHVQERYASGSFGPAMLDNGSQTRALNTTVANTMQGASVASNQVTLQPGDYDLSGMAIVYCNSGAASRHRCILYNVTDGVVALLGSGVAFAANGSPPSILTGRISISSTKVFELRTYSFAGLNGSMYAGGGVGSGQPEICSELYIKEA